MGNRPAADLFYGIVDERVTAALAHLDHDDYNALLKGTEIETITVGYYIETTALVLSKDYHPPVHVYADVAEVDLAAEIGTVALNAKEIAGLFRKALDALCIKDEIKPRWYLAASYN